MEIKKKKKKVVIATICIGFLIIFIIFFINLSRINKNKKALININNKSNIEMSLKSKEIFLPNLTSINKIYDNKKSYKIVIEDVLIDGELLFLGISLSQNLNSSEFKVTSKEDYLPHLNNFKKTIENHEKLSEFEKSVNSALIDIFSSKKIETNIETPKFNTYISMFETLYNWGLSTDDFLTDTFKISDSSSTPLMSNLAIPNIKVKLNNLELPLLLVDSPAIINKEILNKFKFTTTNIPKNFNMTEYTLVYKLDTNLSNESSFNLDIAVDELSISPYYPVTINPNFKTNLTLNNNKAYNTTTINKTLHFNNKELKILNFIKTTSFSYITLEYEDFKNSFYLPISFRDKKNKPLNYLFNHAIPIQDTNYIICMFPQDTEYLNLLLVDENNNVLDSVLIN